jgi:phosphatidylinositol glycan class S
MLVEPHVLQFVVYVPPRQQRPLQLLGRKGKLRDSNSYVIPAWGGLMVLNPEAQGASTSSSTAGGNSPAAAVLLTEQQSQEIAAVVIAQLQALFGVAPAATDSSSSGGSSSAANLQIVVLPAGRSGFSGWQVDALLRQRSGHDVREAARVLAALSTLVQELPNLEMPDLIEEQVCVVFHHFVGWQ